MPECRVCKTPDVGTSPAATRTIYYNCRRCGSYGVTIEAMQQLPDVEDVQRPKLSRWIRDQVSVGVTPVLKADDIAEIASRPPLAFVDKSERLLEFLADNTRLGTGLYFTQFPQIFAITETVDASEVAFIAKHLKDQNLLDCEISQAFLRITGDGLAHVEARRSRPIASMQGFVAMWFDASLSSAWQDAFDPAIRDAGYDPLRIDGKQHNHKICDEIVAEIRRSRFVVADFTGHRGGVYYESGFAAGLGIPVIFTCRKDQLSDIHFDVRQYNTIDWTDEKDLKARLVPRICATIGDGPKRRK